MKLLLIENLFKKIDASSGNNKKFFKFLAIVLVILTIFIILSILFPSATSVILNIIWIVLLAVVIVFLFLGTLVIIGLKKEANSLLDILFERTLTLVDFINFLKELWKRFKELLKEFLLYASPIFAYIINVFLYFILLTIYKTVGKQNDVTFLTVVLTIILITTLAILSNPPKHSSGQSPWFLVFKQKFKSAFVDGIEVLTLLFFLTMDSTKLFFLPKDLNIPISSKIGEYDLMVRSFVYNNHLKLTTILIIVGVISELLRNIVRIVYVSAVHYRKDTLDGMGEISSKWSEKIKEAIRKSFKEAKDDFVKFVTYTTFMFFVFLLFPRLKLLTVGVASITGLFLDFIFPHRLTPTPKTDLISRILIKVFKL